MAMRLVRRAMAGVRYDRSAKRSFAVVADEPPFDVSKRGDGESSTASVNAGDVGKTSGIPPEQLRRKVIIYCPSRGASQQGRSHLGQWKFNFETVEKWENPLMGWTSTGDPYHAVGDHALTFDSKEAAIDFARKHGWEYTVREPHAQTLKPKAYADNFKWKGAPVMDVTDESS